MDEKLYRQSQLPYLLWPHFLKRKQAQVMSPSPGLDFEVHLYKHFALGPVLSVDNLNAQDLV
jgi:hypothetical protein